MDPVTLAYINLYAILGALRPLCELSPAARDILGDSRVDLAFAVKGGPEAMLRFENGGARLVEGRASCDILLKFATAEKFNGMINGTVTPIPSRGFIKLNFLLKKFIKLTDLLSSYLRPSQQDLADEEFFRVSTILLFHVITEAVAQIGNHDRVGRVSAASIVDGNVRLAILPDGPEACITARDHRLSTRHEAVAEYLSTMEIVGLRTARDLFDGKVASFPLICEGQIRLRGMLSQIDNVNRILDRVGLYLA